MEGKQSPVPDGLPAASLQESLAPRAWDLHWDGYELETALRLRIPLVAARHLLQLLSQPAEGQHKDRK